MKTKHMIISVITAGFLTACGSSSSSSITDSTDTTDSSSSFSTSVYSTILDTSVSGTAEGDTDNSGVDADDLIANTTFDGTVNIVYNGSSATVTNNIAGVEIDKDGADITVTSTTDDKIIYKVSGTTTDGFLKIYSDKKFELALSDLSIISSKSPAINIQSKKTVFVVLDGATTLSDAQEYANIPDDEDAKSTFFSEGQLVFSGSGNLSVEGNYKHGIASDDYIRIVEGNITVSKAIKDAIHANDYVIVDGGTFNLSASSDGIDASEGYVIINDGTFNINVADDGIVASYDIEDEEEPDESITPNVTINGGTFDITTTEGEGIESKGEMTINDGTIEINAYDDAINSGGILYINDGKIYAYSSTNDAIDSNTAITITGGTTIAYSSVTNAPEGGFDADANSFKITGGTILGLAATTTVPTDDSTQNSVMMDGTAVNTILHIEDENGSEVLTYQMPSKVDTILYSSTKLSTGTTYNIYSGGTVSDGESFHGLYSSGIYSANLSASSSFTQNSTVTQIGGTVGPAGEPADIGTPQQGRPNGMQ